MVKIGRSGCLNPLERGIAFLLAIHLVSFLVLVRRQNVELESKNNHDTNPSAIPASSIGRRKLQFDDLTFGGYIGSGEVNLACFVTVPDWAFDQYNLSKTQRLLVKFTKDILDGKREIDAYRLMNEDEETARRIKVLPLLFAEHNMTNPFLAGEDDNRTAYRTQSDRHDEECMKKVRKKLTQPQMGALVVPYHQKRNILQVAQTMDDYKRYFRSLLLQLDHAHKLGITNYDLNVRRNVFVDEEGDAILIDWNGNMDFGEKVYDPGANLALMPPEGWFQSVLGYNIVVGPLDVHAVDVWQVGFIFSSMLFSPCEWAHVYCFSNRRKRLLQQTISAISRNTTIDTMARVYTIPADSASANSAEEEIVVVQARDLDWSQFVPVDPSQPVHTPILCDGFRPCNATSFPFYDGLSAEERVQAIDLLFSMFRLSPRDRPTCGQLLKHPFLQE
jgi:serine/threonine protein kinase